TGVEIKRDYKGSYFHNFLPKNPNIEHDIEYVVSLLSNKLGEISGEFSEHFVEQYCSALKLFAEEVRKNGGSNYALAKLPEFKNRLPSFRHPSNPGHSNDNSLIPTVNKTIDETIAKIQSTPLR